jgi:small conductance mechanosensitive channel
MIMFNHLKNLIETATGRFVSFLPSVLLAIIIVVVGLLLSKWAVSSMKKGIEKKKVDPTVFGFVGNLLRVLLGLLTVTIALAVLGVPTNSLIAIIGTAGVAIGLALQGSLSNLVSGILLLVQKPFKVGDFIESGSNSGTVEFVGIMTTRLITPDNRVLYVPNAQLGNSTITNNSGKDTRRVDLEFAIPYPSDIDVALSVLTQNTISHPLVLTDPKPFIRVVDYADSSVKIAVRPWCAISDYWTVRLDLLSSSRKALEAKGISMPFPQLDVHLNQ